MAILGILKVIGYRYCSVYGFDRFLLLMSAFSVLIIV